jgi:hypothetical protein
MTALPKKMTTIESLIDDHHAAQPNGLRLHLGASGLGHKCDRWIWLSFRWAIQEQFPGRILRLFRRGHNEEATIVADLEAIGIKISKTGDDQMFLDFGSHVSDRWTASLKAVCWVRRKRATLRSLKRTG